MCAVAEPLNARGDKTITVNWFYFVERWVEHLGERISIKLDFSVMLSSALYSYRMYFFSTISDYDRFTTIVRVVMVLQTGSSLQARSSRPYNALSTWSHLPYPQRLPLHSDPLFHIPDLICVQDSRDTYTSRHDNCPPFHSIKTHFILF